MFLVILDERIQRAVTRGCNAIRSRYGCTKATMLRCASMPVFLSMTVSLAARAADRHVAGTVFSALNLAMSAAVFMWIARQHDVREETLRLAQADRYLSSVAKILVFVSIALLYVSTWHDPLPPGVTRALSRWHNGGILAANLWVLLFAYVLCIPHEPPPSRRKVPKRALLPLFT